MSIPTNVTDTSAYASFQNLYLNNQFKNSKECPAPNIKSLFDHAQDPVHFFKQLDANQRAELFKQLDADQKTQLIDAFFERDSFTHNLLLTQKSPFIKKANELFNKWKDASTTVKKTLDYSYEFAASDLKTDCSGQKILDSLCLATELKGAFLECTEKPPSYSFIGRMGASYGQLPLFEQDRAPDCTLTLAGPQFGLTQKAQRKVSDIFSKGTAQSTSDAFFKTLPQLDGKKIASTKDLSLQNLLETKVPGSSLFARLTVKAEAPRQSIREVLNPAREQIGLPTAKARNLTPIEVSARFEHLQSPDQQYSQANFNFTDPKNAAWDQKLALTTDFATNTTKIETSNPNIFDNYKAAFKTIGLPFKFEGKALTIGNFQAPNKPQEEDASWSFVPDIDMGRVGEIAVKILAPAALAIAFANESRKFCQKVIAHPKKTPGQKIAGCVVGGTGVLTGVGLAFERLSHLNL